MKPVLSFYNTLSKQKQDFFTLEGDKVKMYVCGPTVYDNPHIGNGRALVFYDFVYRCLKSYYKGEKRVVYVRNVTDVDDKIINRAKERQITIRQLTDEVMDSFVESYRYLYCLEPDFQPKATEHINEMVEIINMLIAGSHAYIAENGDVFFDVSSYKDYGSLSNRNVDEMIAGARVEKNDFKRNPLDFTLWKRTENDGFGFESSLGYGRPGWHIECSAMSTKYLGHTFDLHGGGIDLQFPHHENEIAQSKCAFCGSGFAHFWLHNGFLMVNGEKMSKSLGNFITILDLKNKGFSGEALRLALLSVHYQKPLDFTYDLLERQKQTLDKFYRLIAENIDIYEPSELNFEDLPLEAQESIANDFNTPKLIALMHSLTRDIAYTRSRPDRQKLLNQFVNLGWLLGIFNYQPLEYIEAQKDESFKETIEYKQAYKLALERLEAKKHRDFDRADKIREQIKHLGFVLLDTKDGFDLQQIIR